VQGEGGGNGSDAVAYGAFVLDGSLIDAAIFDATSIESVPGTRVPNAPANATNTDGAWVVDDAWLAAEAVELASRLATAERDWFLAEVPSVLTDDVTPRLLVAPTSIGAAPHAAPRAFVGSSPFEIALPPIVDAAIADRETALMEIAAALEASA